MVNIYIVYEISKNYDIISYPTLESCPFGAVSLTKHVGVDMSSSVHVDSRKNIF